MAGKDSSSLRARIYIYAAAGVGEREERPYAGFVEFRTLWARVTAGLRPAWTGEGARPHTCKG